MMVVGVIMRMIVIVRMRVSVMGMGVMIMLVVDVLHTRRYGYGGRRLRVQLPSKQEH